MKLIRKAKNNVKQYGETNNEQIQAYSEANKDNLKDRTTTYRDTHK